MGAPLQPQAIYRSAKDIETKFHALCVYVCVCVYVCRCMCVYVCVCAAIHAVDIYIALKAIALCT
jgi:hypothetical protein